MAAQSSELVIGRMVQAADFWDALVPELPGFGVQSSESSHFLAVFPVAGRFVVSGLQMP